MCPWKQPNRQSISQPRAKGRAWEIKATSPCGDWGAQEQGEAACFSWACRQDVAPSCK